MNDTHALWQAGYFDYVIEVRTLNDFDFNGQILPGWKTSHVPGSYSIQLACFQKDDCATENLIHFLPSDVCLDSRILVLCWVGVIANSATQVMVQQLGFTNIHTPGPEGEAGWIVWAANGWETVQNDHYDPNRIPECTQMCNNE